MNNVTIRPLILPARGGYVYDGPPPYVGGYCSGTMISDDPT